MDNPTKGQFGGRCNRTACATPDEPAQWFNQSTLRYYCANCAHLINFANFDWGLATYGGPVCVFHAVPEP